MENDEWELLGRFVRDKSQAAFAELVQRHVRLVYGRCARQLGDADAAEDVTQAVFLVLAEKAETLRPNAALGTWLYEVAGYACRNEAKMRARRRHHEAAAAAGRSEVAAADGVDAAALVPLLDAAVDGLGATDRRAVLLRYFEGRSVRDVAEALGVTENAAGRRLLRAVEKLRAAFAKGGVTVPAAAVGAAVAAAVAGTATPTARAAMVPAGATAASRAAGRAVAWAAWKPVAAGVAAAVAATVGGSVAAVHWSRPATATGLPATPAFAVTGGSAVAGGPSAMLYAFDVEVDRGLADAIARAGTPVRSDAVGYDAYDLDGGRLMALLRDGPGGRVRAYGEVARTMTHDTNPFRGRERAFFLGMAAGQATNLRPPRLIVGRMVDGGYTADLVDGRVRVDVDLSVSVEAVGGEAVDPARGRVRYAGDVAAGRAVALVARTGPGGLPVADVQVWQAVECRPEQESFLKLYPPARWVAAGVDGAAAATAAAARWSAAAAAPVGERLAVRWERREPTGEVVRLFAVTRPDERPFQWWDPGGTPVATVSADGRQLGPMSTAFPAGPVAVAAEATDPNGDPRPGRDEPDVRNTVWTVAVAADEPVAVEVGYGVGPWRAGPVAPVGRPGYPASVERVGPGTAREGADPGSHWVFARTPTDPTTEYQVAAVTKGGQTVAPANASSLMTGVPDPAAGGVVTMSTLVPVDLSDVDHYVVRSRRRHWARFEGVATEPTGAPAATRPAPTTRRVPATGSPAAAMVAIATAAARGDAAAVRVAYFCPTPLARELGDALADDAVASARVWAAAVARFGADRCRVALAGSPLAVGDPAVAANVDWQVDGDVATPVSTATVKRTGFGMRRVDGVWRVDLTVPPTADADRVRAGVRQLRSRAAAMADLPGQITAGGFADAAAVRDALTALVRQSSTRP